MIATFAYIALGWALIGACVALSQLPRLAGATGRPTDYIDWVVTIILGFMVLCYIAAFWPIYLAGLWLYERNT